MARSTNKPGCPNCGRRGRASVVRASMGFVEIVQRQCRSCRAPLGTKFLETGDLVISMSGVRVRPRGRGRPPGKSRADGLSSP